MSETDQFWQYANEAMLFVGDAKTDQDKRDLFELARTLDASGITRSSASSS
jgi:hypothetical protein